jgi:cytochrome bd-type quinol oxidase subunit 1
MTGAGRRRLWSKGVCAFVRLGVVSGITMSFSSAPAGGLHERAGNIAGPLLGESAHGAFLNNVPWHHLFGRDRVPPGCILFHPFWWRSALRPLHSGYLPEFWMQTPRVLR